MPNKLRDPHDPVIPSEHVPSPEDHGGVSMPIGQSNPGFDPHEPVLPDGMHGSESYEAMQWRVERELQGRVGYQHVEDTQAAVIETHPTEPQLVTDPPIVIDPIAQHVSQAQIAIDQQKATLPSATDLDAVEAEKDIADSTAKAESAKGRVSRRP